MSKGVIYIDTEDDITAIVGKVKAAKERIVALVPPARIGVLQSAVNLRILARTAEKEDKRLVLITNNSALLPLAANAKIPVAKTLQSKPGIPQIDTIQIDEDVDIIDGSSIPVEDYVKQSQPKESKEKEAAVASIAAAEKVGSGPEASKSIKKEASKPRKTKSVPDFNKLRSKLMIAGGVFVLLIVSAVLFTMFGSKASITLQARTSIENVSTGVSLLTDTGADIDESSIQAIRAEVEKNAEVEFTATGKREEGEHATGTITILNDNRRPQSIEVGYAFSNGNCTFTATRSVTVPGYTPADRRGDDDAPGTADVPVRATQPGDECNLSPRTYQVNSEELNSRDVTAQGGAMSGGSIREVTFVTQADVQKATEQLAQNSDDSIRKELERELGERVFAIEESFAAEASNPVSTPAIGDEAAEGKAKLAVSAVYVMYGVEEGAIAKFVERAVNQKLPDEDSQRVYEVITDSVSFNDFSPQEYGGVAMLVAEAEVGPDVKEDEIKKMAMGKRFGDIQAELQRMQGIEDVEVKFTPFWVNTVPEDEEKIIVKFNIQD